MTSFYKEVVGFTFLFNWWDFTKLGNNKNLRCHVCEQMLDIHEKINRSTA